MNVVLFEDRAVSQLRPVTTGRAAYSISCGSYRLVDWIGQLGNSVVGLVRPHLQTLQLCDFPNFQSNLDLRQPFTLLVNARLVPSVSNIRMCVEFKEDCLSNYHRQLLEGKWLVAANNWQAAAMVVSTDTLMKLDGQQDWLEQIDQLDSLPPSQLIRQQTALQLFEYPHDVIRHNMICLIENLEHRIASGRYEQFEHGVFMGRGVNFGHHVVFDARQGPIVVDDGASLGPFSLLRGPVYLGVNSKLSEYASIKDFVSISDHSKIGGEVEASVIEAYSNKQHHGFLGHSYLGSWINLGAGTCNSDLKNTYGVVSVEHAGHKVSTGMQFLGCVIGDYSKTAINTSLFTGKFIGNASMVYGFATRNVPSFVNYARTFNEVGLLPPEVIIATQARMFARRNVEQRPCDIQLIHDMFRLTADERPEGLSDTPLSL